MALSILQMQFLTCILIGFTCLMVDGECSFLGGGGGHEMTLRERVYFLAETVALVKVTGRYHYDFSEDYPNATWPHYPYDQFGYISVFEVMCHFKGAILPQFVNVTGAGTRSLGRCSNEDADIGETYIALLIRSNEYEELGLGPDQLELDPANIQEALIEPTTENLKAVYTVCSVTPSGEGCPSINIGINLSCYNGTGNGTELDLPADDRNDTNNEDTTLQSINPTDEQPASSAAIHLLWVYLITLLCALYALVFE